MWPKQISVACLCRLSSSTYSSAVPVLVLYVYVVTEGKQPVVYDEPFLISVRQFEILLLSTSIDRYEH
jgi:hypothetical protein